MRYRVSKNILEESPIAEFEPTLSDFRTAVTSHANVITKDTNGSADPKSAHQDQNEEKEKDADYAIEFFFRQKIMKKKESDFSFSRHNRLRLKIGFLWSPMSIIIFHIKVLCFYT